MTTRVTPRHASRSAMPQQRAGHGGIGRHLLQPPARPVLIGNPHAAHQHRLADVQRRDPFDDLLVVLRPGQHLASSRRAEEPPPARAWAQLKESNPRARSDNERPVSWLPAPGLETTLTIKLVRRQRTAATPIFRPEPASVQDINGLEDRWRGFTLDQSRWRPGHVRIERPWVTAPTRWFSPYVAWVSPTRSCPRCELPALSLAVTRAGVAVAPGQARDYSGPGRLLHFVWLAWRMLRLTLDTSCVIDAAQGGVHSAEIDQLVNLARAGDVGLWLTSAFDIDQARASDENYRINLQWLSERPLIRQVPGPFRFDLSTFDGPDVLVSDEIAEADEKIKSILRPSYKAGDAFPSRKVNDIHHLTAHLMSGHDAFVTQDEDDMIKRRQVLRSDVGITVVTVAGAVALAMGS
jgi:hypothetical protein